VLHAFLGEFFLSFKMVALLVHAIKAMRGRRHLRGLRRARAAWTIARAARRRAARGRVERQARAWEDALHSRIEQQELRHRMHRSASSGDLVQRRGRPGPHDGREGL
jgi:hypothetical protein